MLRAIGLLTLGILVQQKGALAADEQLDQIAQSQKQALTVVSDEYFGFIADDSDELMVGIGSCIDTKVYSLIAPLFTLDGKSISEFPPEMKREFQEHRENLKRAGVSNTFTIVFDDDSSVKVELLEVHIVDQLDDSIVKKTLCTQDGKYCEDQSEWFLISVNGYKSEIVVEEIRSFTLSNGRKFNLAVMDNDVDFCYQVIQ